MKMYSRNLKQILLLSQICYLNNESQTYHYLCLWSISFLKRDMHIKALST